MALKGHQERPLYWWNVLYLDCIAVCILVVGLSCKCLRCFLCEKLSKQHTGSLGIISYKCMWISNGLNIKSVFLRVTLFRGDPWYFRITDPNLQKSPNTRKRTCSCRLCPASPFPQNHPSPRILGPPHSTCAGAHPSLYVHFHSTILVTRVTAPTNKLGALVLLQEATDARSWAAQLHTSVKRQIAGKISEHRGAKCRGTKGMPRPHCFLFGWLVLVFVCVCVWMKWIIGVCSDVPTR